MAYTKQEKKIIQDLSTLLENQGQEVSEDFLFDLRESIKDLN